VSSPARALAVVVAVVLAAALAGPAAANDARDARVRSECSRGSEAELRLRTDDGELRVELRIESPPGARWSVILLRERRIVFRGSVRATRSSGARVRRTLRDLYGRDRVVVRASGPRSETCRISATV
jgi:2-methylaconitate cis-trans-isomerase PrpF